MSDRRTLAGLLERAGGAITSAGSTDRYAARNENSVAGHEHRRDHRVIQVAKVLDRPQSGPRRAERADTTEQPAKGESTGLQGQALGWFDAFLARQRFVDPANEGVRALRLLL